MNTRYFNDSEDKCWKSLNDLNQKKNYFKELTKSPSGSSWDASGITRDGRRAIIELKHRNAILDGNSVSGTNFHSDGLFIEIHKHSSLMLHWVVDGLIPLYINFLQDGNVVIFNLLKLTHYKEYNNLKVKSLGYEKMEMNARRYNLFLDDATIVSI